MGLFNAVLGNASEINIEDIRAELNSILAPGEELESAFKIIRDKWVFTDKRLIMIDVQGMTGKKREYHSIPYKSITHFAIETAGTFDDDSEMKIWVSSMAAPYVKEFSRNVNIKAIQQSLAYHVLNK